MLIMDGESASSKLSSRNDDLVGVNHTQEAGEEAPERVLKHVDPHHVFRPSSVLFSSISVIMLRFTEPSRSKDAQS